MGSTQRRWVLVSPLAVVGAGALTARVAAPRIGAWAWLPVFVVYLAAMATVVVSSHSMRAVLAGFHRPSGRGWWVLCLAVGLIPLPILLLHLSLLGHTALALWWIVVAVVNPFFEESYWRGALGEATRQWPGWVACLYSSLCFAASHPLMWGVFSRLNRRPDTLLTLLLMGLVWSATYRKTGSLRSVTVSHMLVDLGNLSVFAFLNLFTPPASF